MVFTRISNPEVNTFFKAKDSQWVKTHGNIDYLRGKAGLLSLYLLFCLVIVYLRIRNP